MEYSKNKKLQKLCHNFSSFEDSIFADLGQDWREEFYRDCYAWDQNLKKNNLKKWRKVIDKFGEAEMNMLSFPCMIKKFFENNEMDIKEITEEEYKSLLIYIFYDFDIYEALQMKTTTPSIFKFLLNNAIEDFSNNDVGEKILKLAYKYRDNPSKFIDVMIKNTIDV